MSSTINHLKEWGAEGKFIEFLAQIIKQEPKPLVSDEQLLKEASEELKEVKQKIKELKKRKYEKEIEICKLTKPNY